MEYNNILEGYLVSNLFAVLIVFARLGSALMIMPGFGEFYVLARSRLLLALILSLAMAPFLEPYLPEVPDDPARLMLLLLGEIMIGLLIATVARILISAMHVAGMVISFQSSLALANQFDITQASQSSIIGNFLSVTAMVFIFSLDLHHMLLRGITDSYTLMLPGAMPPVDDIADYLARLVSYMYRVGVQLAGPSIAAGLLLYLAAGILSRVMPNMQVFFVIMPLQIALSFFILMIAFNTIMIEFAEYFSATFSDFLEGI